MNQVAWSISKNYFDYRRYNQGNYVLDGKTLIVSGKGELKTEIDVMNYEGNCRGAIFSAVIDGQYDAIRWL